MNTITDKDRIAMCRICTLGEYMKQCRLCALNTTGKDKNPGILEQMSEKVTLKQDKRDIKAL